MSFTGNSLAVGLLFAGIILVASVLAGRHHRQCEFIAGSYELVGDDYPTRHHGAERSHGDPD